MITTRGSRSFFLFYILETDRESFVQSREKLSGDTLLWKSAMEKLAALGKRKTGPGMDYLFVGQEISHLLGQYILTHTGRKYHYDRE